MDEWERAIDTDERPRPKRGTYAWLIALAVLVVLAIGGAVLWQRRGDVAAIVQPPAALDAGVAEVPPAEELDAGQEVAEPKGPRREPDDVLRKAVGKVSKSELLAGWLASPGVVQRLAAAARLVSVGQTPRPVLAFIEIPGDFEVTDEGSKQYIDPVSYGRYNAVTEALTDIDPRQAARAYAEVRPYFDMAYAQVAKPGERFDDVLASAIQRLLLVKIPEGRIEVVPKGAVYAFADPTLEALSPAEKQLIRMGPGNAKAIQRMLERFQGALR